jgi:hypothetical protein
LHWEKFIQHDSGQTLYPSRLKHKAQPDQGTCVTPIADAVQTTGKQQATTSASNVELLREPKEKDHGKRSIVYHDLDSFYCMGVGILATTCCDGTLRTTQHPVAKLPS